MITLITGEPGSGKTAFVVDLISKEVGKRLIYVDGIKELKIEHFPVPHIDDWVSVTETKAGGLDYDWIGFPPGSLIVLDECQRFFRPRHVSKAPPAAVAGFETHRHAGLDFILLTQDSTFLDSNVRKLLAKHIHIQDSWLGKFSYTWLREGNPKEKSSLNEASRMKYKIPVSAFPFYKSAELHTKKSKPTPLLVYVGGISLIAFVVLAFMIVDSVTSRGETVAETSKSQSSNYLGQVNHSSSAWYVVGWISGRDFLVVISDGTLQRIVAPASFKRSGSDLEATLIDGTFVTTWGRDHGKQNASPLGS